MKHFLPFEQVRQSHGSTLGNKGYTLALLYRKGFPVPRGYCLPSTAGKEFMDPLVAAHELYLLPTGEQRRRLGALRDSIRGSPVPPGIAADITELFSLLEGPFIVRSSGSDEDGTLASFAGVFTTVSPVSSPGELEDAIRHVWASLWSHEAFVYREVHHIPPMSASMAIVVQKEISPALSGVLFTVNPLSGDHEMVINAHEGHGRLIAEGSVTPTEYLLRAQAPPGTCPVERRGKLELPGELVESLAGTGRSLERLFGWPQDIEWGYDGTLWIFQSRPLSSSPGCRWVHDPLVDVVPEFLTPFASDFYREYIGGRMGALYRELGIRLPALPLVREFGGKLYLSTCIESAVMEQAASEQGRARHMAAAFSMLRTLQGRLWDYRAKMESLALRGEEGGGDPWELLREARELICRNDPALFITHLYGYLRESLARLLPGGGASSLDTLEEALAPGPGSSFEEALFDDLALLAGELASGFSQPCAVNEQAALLSHPGVHRFRHTYRYWSDRPLELQHGRLGENDGLFLALMRSSALEGRRKAAKRREACREKARQSLSELRALLRLAAGQSCGEDLLEWLLFLSREREEQRRYTMVAAALLRTLMRQGARMLIRQGFPEDLEEGIFFLTLDEFGSVKGAHSHAALWQAHYRHVMEERKRLQTMGLPDEFEGLVPRIHRSQGAPLFSGESLKGISLSRGRVTAPCRVMDDSFSMETFQGGEILVVPRSDPLWAALFPLASGFITGTGGPLSHGAILAREFKIPAVSGMTFLVSHVKTGDILTIDGDEGTVMLHGSCGEKKEEA
ncbi:MAG: PEP/pyruvate-binding domain-containing protein [Candidatus Eremiobacteraeota bacterium]|nr:PEP/pyruvate-binding domain-containing protein [Candidatus Eremiobacteraeota bacterium]